MEITLNTVTFDCADAAEIGRFWSDLLGCPLDDGATPEFAGIATSTPQLAFVRVPEGKQVKNRVHVDLASNDLAAAVDRAVQLGAVRVGDHSEDGYRWSTLADPEGNEFDIVAA